MTASIPEVGAFGDLSGIIDTLNKILGTNSNGTESTNLGGDASGALQAFVSRFLPTFDANQYSPENADKDAATITDQIIKQFQENDLPDIFSAQNTSGGYNSTTAQLLADDARARAVGKASKSAVDLRDSYAKQRQAQTEQFLKLVLGLAAVNRSTSKQSTTGASSQAAKNAALAAMAAKALGAKDKGTGSSSLKSKPNPTPKAQPPAPDNRPYSETGNEKLDNLTDFTLPDLTEEEKSTADQMISQQLDQTLGEAGFGGDPVGADYGANLTNDILANLSPDLPDSTAFGDSGSDGFSIPDSGTQFPDIGGGDDSFANFLDNILGAPDFSIDNMDNGFDFTFDSSSASNFSGFSFGDGGYGGG